jgi:hypothetical protein
MNSVKLSRRLEKLDRRCLKLGLRMYSDLTYKETPEEIAYHKACDELRLVLQELEELDSEAASTWLKSAPTQKRAQRLDAIRLDYNKSLAFAEQWGGAGAD